MPANLSRLTTLGALAAMVLHVPTAAAGQAGVRRADQAALDAAFQRMVDVHGLVGLQVAIRGPAGPVYEGTFGYADRAAGTPVTSETLFPSASVGKAFTSAALLSLWERGRIDLNAPIDTYVRRAPDHLSDVTPGLLAVHQGGIRHYREEERTGAFFATHYENVDDALELFIDDELIMAPGTGTSYSSYGYNLLAAAIERVGKRPFDEFVLEGVLRPLGLRQTVFHDVRRPPAQLATLYSYSDPSDPRAPRTDSLFVVPATRDYSYNAGGGNWLTSARDLAIFGQQAFETTLLGRRARTLQSEGAELEDGTPTDVAFGWFAGPTHLGRTSRINGAFVGAYADLRVYPDRHLSIAIMTNTSSVGSLNYATDGIAEYLIGEANDATAALEGALWFQFRRWEQAAQAYGRLVELEPRDQRSLLRLGIALLNAGDLVEARSALWRVGAPQFRDETYYYRIVLEALEEDLDAAFQALDLWSAGGEVNWDALDRDLRLGAFREDPRYAARHPRR
ncbi:MAG: serine hydrolase domain-containing protein [Gemmatimonadota bacterium]|nr:serine hydrolase domain-containing protein [Gemmatimonadota bacterium]